MPNQAQQYHSSTRSSISILALLVVQTVRHDSTNKNTVYDHTKVVQNSTFSMISCWVVQQQSVVAILLHTIKYYCRVLRVPRIYNCTIVS